MNGDLLLEIKHLSVQFHTYKATVKAIQDVNLSIHEGETLGLVGESGCGKTVTASAILQLIPCPPGKIVAGAVMFHGQNLLAKTDKEMRGIRGKTISMIFQDPMTSLNPVYTIGDQVKTVVRTHQKTGPAEAAKRACDMLSLVGLSDPAATLKKYPHELSGGMCQRVMIAMALSCRPSLLIADEPTTALDVTVQAQILQLMNNLKRELGTAILLITHDLGVIAKMCTRVAVMYAGRIVEYGALNHIFETPGHPYTCGLLASTPRIGEGKDQLAVIEGTVPDLSNLPDGCLFRQRCDRCVERCSQQVPEFSETRRGHFVACHKAA